jgi:hypothetical protein
MTVWSSLNTGEIGTLQDLRDSCDVGYFTEKISFSGSPKAVQKDEVNTYVNFTAFAGYNAKDLNQLIAKEDIGAFGGGPPPPTPTPTPTPTQTLTLPTLYYVTKQLNCVDTDTTAQVTLGAQVSAPIVGQFVTLYDADPNGFYSGCWKVTSIGTGYGATTITANYGSGEGACYCNVVPTTPAIIVTGTLTGPTVCSGVASVPQTFTVSGTNLVANVVVTPPSGYEVSTYDGGYASSVSLSPSVGTLSNTTIYIRLSSTANNGNGGNVNITSTNAVTQTINTGTATVNERPTVTSVTNGSRSGTGTVTLSATASPGATIDWYDGSNNLLASGTTSFTTPSISVTTTYYVRARNTTTGCVSTGTSAVIATINANNNFKSAIIDCIYYVSSTHVYRLAIDLPIPYATQDVIVSSNSSDRHAPSSATTAPNSYLIAGYAISQPVGNDRKFQRFGINLQLIKDSYPFIEGDTFTFSLYGTRISSSINPDYSSIDYSRRVNSLIDSTPYEGVDFSIVTTSFDEDPSAQLSQITTGNNIEQKIGYFTWNHVNNTFIYTDL